MNDMWNANMISGLRGVSEASQQNRRYEHPLFEVTLNWPHKSLHENSQPI